MEANPTSLRRSVFRFKDGTARNTPRIPPAKWDEHKELLCLLYQNMTVDEILAFMRTEHGFVAKYVYLIVHTYLDIASRLNHVLSFVVCKSNKSTTITLTLLSARQLGRKLRDWAVYKYDSKNRPSISVHTETGDHNNPESLPVVGSNMDLRYPLEQNLPDTEPSAPVPPAANSSNVPDIFSKTRQILDGWITTASARDVACSIELSKSKPVYPAKALTIADWVYRIVLKTYTESFALLEGRPKEEPLQQLSVVVLLVHLLAGRERLRRRFASDLERFGEVYAHGDPEIQEQLIDISMRIQTKVLSSLQSSRSDDVRVSYEALQFELQKEEDLAIFCLERYSHRLSEAAAAAAAAAAAKDSKRPDWLISTPPETLANSNDWPSRDSRITEGFDSFSTTQYRQILGKYESPAIPKIPTVVKEAEHGRLSDIDMDRFSMISLTSSVMSGFASFRSLEQRIKMGESPASRNSADDIPSSVMNFNRSSTSLRLFLRPSDRWSSTSSLRTASSRMSWRLETSEPLQKGSENRGIDIPVDCLHWD